MIEDSWTFRGSRDLRKYRTVLVREDTYWFAPLKKEADFVICESADWALVLALTSVGEVVLARQFRPAIRGVVLEIPGGVMEEGESPCETAARELLEETGYVASSYESLPPFLPNPALNTAQCHVVIARDCHYKSPPQFDGLEQIEVELRPLADIPEMIRRGELPHALSIAAFSIAKLHGEL